MHFNGQNGVAIKLEVVTPFGVLIKQSVLGNQILKFMNSVKIAVILIGSIDMTLRMEE
jgi:hypothetical protein